MSKDITTEQRILEAAKHVFFEQGMAGARMQTIADKAGINKAMLHYYFRSKQKLFDAIFFEVTADFFHRVNDILKTSSSLYEKIRQFCSVYIDLAIQQPYLPAFLLVEINKDPKTILKKINGRNPPALKQILLQIEEAIIKGEIKRIHPGSVIMNILSLCVFPFIGKPLLQAVLKLDNKKFQNIMEVRKKEVAELMIAFIKNE
jgi:AcrR family transcriptional regulator